MHSHDSSHSTQTSNYFLIRHDIIYRNLHVGIDVKNASSTTCLHTLIQCWKALIWSEWIYKLMPTHTRFNSHHDRRMSFQYQLIYWKCDQFSIVFILHFQFGFYLVSSSKIFLHSKFFSEKQWLSRNGCKKLMHMHTHFDCHHNKGIWIQYQLL